MTTSRLLSVSALSALVALASACAAPPSEDGDATADAISAKQANDSQHKLRSLLSDVRAGRAAERLGYAKWDVYAGKNGDFEGAVFYASDDKGDARVFFAFDVASKSYAVGQLDEAGRAVDAPLDRATLDALLADVRDLRDAARAKATRDCVTDLGIAALAGVVAAGASVFVGTPVLFGAAAGATGLATTTDFVAAITLVVGAKGAIAAVVGIASSSAVAAVTGTVGSCKTAARGVPGPA